MTYFVPVQGLLTLAVAAVTLAFLRPGRQEAPIAYGYTGTLPSEPSLLAGTYFKEDAVQRLIRRLSDGALPRASVEEALASSAATLGDLERTGLVREHEGRFYVAFNYFTRADARRIRSVANAHVPSLVAAYVDRRTAFDSILSHYPVPTVPKDILTFVVVAGFSLNWDALETTELRGWRLPLVQRGESGGVPWRYSFWAAEQVPEYSTRSFFWGSSTFPGRGFNYAIDPVDFAFSSFGDPFSDPRMNFPDLLYVPGTAMYRPVREIAERIGLADRTELGREIHDALGLELGRSIGPLLFALRRGPKSAPELEEAVHEEHRPALPHLLDLLEEVQYVAREGDRYVLRVPALDDADAETLHDALDLSRGILESWLAEAYPLIREELSDLSSVRHGVPFTSLFTQIWHDLFGMTTRDLVARGFMADPYSPDRRYPGSLPVVWRQSLHEHEPP